MAARASRSLSSGPVSDCAFVLVTTPPAQISVFERTVPFLSIHFVASIVGLQLLRI